MPKHLPHSLVLGLVGTDEDDQTVMRPLLFPFAHHRLVLLYSRLGRRDDALRHWEIFQQTFTNSDPELHPMIEEARQALAAAQVSP